MAGIRVNTGVKRIDVNDNGDYITINLNDNTFLDRFFLLYENLVKMADESSAKESAVREKYKDYVGNKNGGSGDVERLPDGMIRDVLSLYKDAGKTMMGEVDGLFGEGTCKKVFGDITPSFPAHKQVQRRQNRQCITPCWTACRRITTAGSSGRITGSGCRYSFASPTRI